MIVTHFLVTFSTSDFGQCHCSSFTTSGSIITNETKFALSSNYPLFCCLQQRLLGNYIQKLNMGLLHQYYYHFLQDAGYKTSKPVLSRTLHTILFFNASFYFLFYFSCSRVVSVILGSTLNPGP